MGCTTIVFFKKKNWRTWVLFVGPLISLFQTSGDVSSGFQTQSGQPYAHYVLHAPWDWPLVRHLLTSWRPARMYLWVIGGTQTGSYHATTYRIHIASLCQFTNNIVDPVQPRLSLSWPPELEFRLLPKWQSSVANTAHQCPALADPVFYCLFMYANEWREKATTVLAVPWTQAQAVNRNSTLTGKETDHTWRWTVDRGRLHNNRCLFT